MTDYASVSKGEEALRAATLAREAFLNQLGEGVIVANAAGTITFVNYAAERLHGQALLGVAPGNYTASYNLLTMEGQPYPDAELPLARAVLHGEEVTEARWRIRRSDGSEILAIGSARPIHDSHGQQIGSVLTIRDDTQRHADELALQQLVRTKEMLLQEVNHRVKNSLQLVTSLLSLQAMRSDQAEVRQGLNEAVNRVAVVARIHERLYSTNAHDRIEIGQLLRDVAADNFSAHRQDDRIELMVQCDTCVIRLDQAVPLALCLSELMVNAIKYAFPDGRSGRIWLDVSNRADGRLSIALQDNGVGLPDGFDLTGSKGVGTQIVKALTRQLQATLSFAREHDRTVVRIEFVPTLG